MGLRFHLRVDFGVLRRAGRDARCRIASMAVGAAQSHGARGMHGRLILADVAGDAAGALGVRGGLTLLEQTRLRWLGRLSLLSWLRRQSVFQREQKNDAGHEDREVTPGHTSAGTLATKGRRPRECLSLKHSIELSRRA